MKNEYLVTKKLYMSWVTGSRFTPPQLWFTFFWGALAILFTICAVFYDSLRLYFIFYTLLCLYMAFFRRMLTALVQFRALARSYGLKGEKTWTRTIEFKEEEIVLSDGVCTIRFQYDNLDKIEEKDDRIVLRFKNKMNIRMFRSTFVEGDWLSCKEMLLSKKQAGIQN